MSSATVLLVHGAFCGDWVYWKLIPALEERGLKWVGADLPSCKAQDTSVGPLDDVAYIRNLITQIDGPVVVSAPFAPPEKQLHVVAPRIQAARLDEHTLVSSTSALGRMLLFPFLHASSRRSGGPSQLASFASV